ncbi:MAG TPA: ABC transporter ATP-binding protein [Nitrososphaerales archaeon]|nr:ABC transporter ATP-binding protein [Nitrososphaerales archaeon]
MTSDGLLCDSLTKVYHGSEGKKALDSVSLHVPSHGVFSLIGMNGAGKTTLVRILATQLEQTSGAASIDGLDVIRDAKKIRRRIACVPQEARTVPWMTPKQTVLSYLLWRGSSYRDANKGAVEALARVGLQSQENVLNRRLSGGMKRKVLVATVLSSDADIIFLDEPTTGLDPISRQELWKFLTTLAQNRFLILTTHYLEEAERLADMIGVLHEGELVGLGTLEELRAAVKYQYSVMVASDSQLPAVKDGTVTEGRSGQTQILTNESEAYDISRALLEGGAKFSMSKISLEDIFFRLVHRTSQEAEGD